MNKIITITLIISLISCKEKETNLEYEQRVMNAIFVDLVDYIYDDKRTMLIPPPYLEKGISDSLKNEKIKWYKNVLTERQARVKKIKNDTSRIVIAVFDTIERSSMSDKDELIKYYNVKPLLDTTTNRTEYIIDLSKIQKSNKYIFKNANKFPKAREMWREKGLGNYPFYLGAAVSFSRIQFDQNKTYGVLQGGISYDILNGTCYRFFIKREKNNKWVIEKIKVTCIS